MDVSGVEIYRARDGREIGLVIRADFDDFASHPPTFDTAEERAWLERHYRVDSPELERRTKAHVTADELPLQVTVLNRPAGAFVNPHYHTNERSPQTATRHQVMVCLGGAVRIGLFATDGDHVEDGAPGEEVVGASLHHSPVAEPGDDSIREQQALTSIRGGQKNAAPGDW